MSSSQSSSSSNLKLSIHTSYMQIEEGNNRQRVIVRLRIDCKTVRILRIQVRASSQTKGLERRACETRALRARKTLTPRFTNLFTDFEKKPTVLQSRLRRDNVHLCAVSKVARAF